MQVGLRRRVKGRQAVDSAWHPLPSKERLLWLKAGGWRWGCRWGWGLGLGSPVVSTSSTPGLITLITTSLLLPFSTAACTCREQRQQQQQSGFSPAVQTRAATDTDGTVLLGTQLARMIAPHSIAARSCALAWQLQGVTHLGNGCSGQRHRVNAGEHILKRHAQLGLNGAPAGSTVVWLAWVGRHAGAARQGRHGDEPSASSAENRPTAAAI
jgi:hypothetical protein